MSSGSQSPSASSQKSATTAGGHHGEMRSPLKPLFWMAVVLAALIAFGAYYN